MKALIEYILLKSAKNEKLHNLLTQLLKSDGNNGNLGLILSERLVNMPPQIAQPMYNMLQQELVLANTTVSPTTLHYSHPLANSYPSSQTLINTLICSSSPEYSLPQHQIYHKIPTLSFLNLYCHLRQKQSLNQKNKVKRRRRNRKMVVVH